MRPDKHEQHYNLKFIIYISVTATIGGFLFGFDSGVINGTIDGLQQAFQSNSVGTGFNVSSMLLGCALGALIAGYMADEFGRKRMLIATAVLFILSAWGSGYASNSTEFIIFRIIGGLAVGAASVMAPAYISEIAPANIRGRLSSIQQVAIIFGLFCAFSSNYLLAKTAGSSLTILWAEFEAWRWMFWIELVPAVLFLLALLPIPESPRYLVAKGQLIEAEKVLTKIFDADEAHDKISQIKQSLTNTPHDKPTTKTKKLGLPAIVWVGIGLATFQQLVGINVVFYYGAVLWQAVGFSESDALFINIISGAVSVAACFVAMLLIDRIGRKPLLWIGSAGMSLTLAIMGICFANGDIDAQGQLSLSDNLGIVALVAAHAYLAFFNASWGPVMWVMLGEMFSNRIRGSGLAIAGLCQWLANFSITITFPVLLTSIGLASTYSIYAACAVISIGFVVLFVKETRNKELEQMDELRNDSPKNEPTSEAPQRATA